MAEGQAKEDNMPKTYLIINDLPLNITEEDLYHIFRRIGPVKGYRVMMISKTGRSYGYGFVNYAKAEDVSRVICVLNGHQVRNKKPKVSCAHPYEEDIKKTNLYITNLPRHISEDYLDTLFGPYGIIVEKILLKDKLTGISRRVTFVKYDKCEEAQQAIHGLNGMIPEQGTKPLSVQIDKSRGWAGSAATQSRFIIPHGGAHSGSHGMNVSGYYAVKTADKSHSICIANALGGDSRNTYNSHRYSKNRHRRYMTTQTGGGYNGYAG